jgi:hypothetical protein
MREELRQGILHGSPSWETATINRDLIQGFTHPNGSQTKESKIAYKFEIKIKNSTLISVNNSAPIWLDVNDELSLDFPVFSVKLLDNTGVFRYIAYL